MGKVLKDHDVTIVTKARDIASRVVFISGGAFTPAAHAFLDRVPNERLAKPFQPEQIRALLRRYVSTECMA